MRECDDVDVQDVLPDYLGGTLGAAERARVERHLDACEGCRAELALLRGVRAMHRAPAVDVARIVAALPKPPLAAPADLAPAIPDVVSLDAHRARRRPGGAGAAAFQWRRAAGIVAVLLVGGVTWGVTQRTPDVRPRSVDPLTVTPGERPDTSRVAIAPPMVEPTPPVGTLPIAPPTPRTPRVDVAALGSLGGVASDASDEEIDALIAALDKISGVPELEAEESVQEEGA